MLGRKKKQNEEWHVKAYRIGDKVYQLSESLATRILAQAALNNEAVEVDDLLYYSSALLFAVLDFDLYFTLDNKNRRGREAVMGKAIDGFIAARRVSHTKAHSEELPVQKEKDAEICINVYLQDLRANFNPGGGGSGMLGVTKELSEVYANRLIEKFGLSIDTAKFAVGLASKATTEIAATSASAKW